MSLGSVQLAFAVCWPIPGSFCTHLSCIAGIMLCRHEGCGRLWSILHLILCCLSANSLGWGPALTAGQFGNEGLIHHRYEGNSDSVKFLNSRKWPLRTIGAMYDRLPLKQPVLSLIRPLGLTYPIYKHLHFAG